MTLRVVVDPYVLAVPAEAESRVEVEGYVDQLLQWRRLQQETWVQGFISEGAAESLLRDGAFPFYPNIKEAFERWGIEHIAVSDVVVVANVLLSQTRSIESEYGIGEVLADPIEFDPNVPGARLGVGVAGELGRCLVLMAVVSHVMTGSVPFRLATREAESLNGMLRVSGTVIEVESRAGTPLGFAPCPWTVSEEIVVCETFAEVVRSCDPIMFWVSLQSVAGLELAIRLAIFDYAVVQQAGIEWEHTALMFDVGREFWESVVRHGFHTGEGRARRLLRACLETVMGLALGSTHELREGAAAAAPQVRRGPERGWRRDIDDDFHLHYWQQAGRRPEFAIVVPHNEFVIPR